MSYAETRQIMADLREIMALLDNTTVKSERLVKETPRIRDAADNFMQLERVALRYLTIARRLGLPDEVARATEFLSRLLVVIRMVQISTNMLMLGTPYGWAMGAAGLVLSGLSIYDSTAGY